MLVIELTRKKSSTEAEKYLEGHREFLKKYYDAGYFIASGPKVPRDGGIIIATGSKERIGEIIKEAPFYTEDITDYRIIEFNATKFCDEIKSIAQAEEVANGA